MHHSSASLLRGAVDTFHPGDSTDLLAAIQRARRRTPDLTAAAHLAARHAWEQTFAAELEDLERLIGWR
ncbi:MAG TPA: hypothetical protein VHX62_14455 [Solirubrobacteraceae bacterium]|nr:hypothetical protein [Solirubrobacteraceae bacterium]